MTPFGGWRANTILTAANGVDALPDHRPRHTGAMCLRSASYDYASQTSWRLEVCGRGLASAYVPACQPRGLSERAAPVSSCETSFLLSLGVSVVGTLVDVEPVYAGAALAVAPRRQGEDHN